MTGAQDNYETGGKGNILMEEKEMDNILSGDTTARQNMMEWNRRKSYSEIVLVWVKRKARVGD